MVDSKDKGKLYDDILSILKLKQQVYWVCSCIDFTETLESEYLTSMYEKISIRFKNYRIEVLHGRNSFIAKENSARFIWKCAVNF